MDWTIPKGMYRLSLYLANDINYYEPGREYSIYLTDGGNAVLAACPVRRFEAGVYHHFVVKGPRQLSIRIFRNLSMNVLLQGIFMDGLDTRTDAMATAATHGPWGELLGRQQPRMGASRPATSATQPHRDNVPACCCPSISCSGSGGPRLLNDYGVGRGFTRQASRVCIVRDVKRCPPRCGAIGGSTQGKAGDACSSPPGWTSGARQRSATACGSTGHPRHAVRLALLRRLRGTPASRPLPLDEAYSRELADEFIRRPEPTARRWRRPTSCPRETCALRARLALQFAAVGADNLGSSDLLLAKRARPAGGSTQDGAG